MRPLQPVVRRSMWMGGLRLMVSRPGALVWTYVANLGVALLFSLRVHAQFSSLLDHSMAAERLNSAFDVGTLISVMARLGRHAPSAGGAPYAGLPVYLLVYFLLVPGTLVCYRAAVRARLGTLLSSGICLFWRFVRITLLTLLVSALVLGPLFAIGSAWSSHLDDNVVGVSAIYQKLPVWVLILLVASLLRLYFDLVEVYTVQLDTHSRADGRPDRRVRRVLLPALKTLWWNLPRALTGFVFVALTGLVVVLLLGRVAVHMSAQPRMWPAFLLLQAGLFVNLAMRFWQRGAETILAQDHPLPLDVLPLTGVEIQPGCSAAVEPTVLRVSDVSSRPVAVHSESFIEPVSTAPLDRSDEGLDPLPPG